MIIYIKVSLSELYFNSVDSGCMRMYDCGLSIYVQIEKNTMNMCTYIYTRCVCVHVLACSCYAELITVCVTWLYTHTTCVVRVWRMLSWFLLQLYSMFPHDVLLGIYAALVWCSSAACIMLAFAYIYTYACAYVGLCVSVRMSQTGGRGAPSASRARQLSPQSQAWRYPPRRAR